MLSSLAGRNLKSRPLYACPSCLCAVIAQPIQHVRSTPRRLQCTNFSTTSTSQSSHERSNEHELDIAKGIKKQGRGTIGNNDNAQQILDYIRKQIDARNKLPATAGKASGIDAPSAAKDAAEVTTTLESLHDLNDQNQNQSVAESVTTATSLTTDPNIPQSQPLSPRQKRRRARLRKQEQVKEQEARNLAKHKPLLYRLENMGFTIRPMAVPYVAKEVARDIALFDRLEAIGINVLSKAREEQEINIQESLATDLKLASSEETREIDKLAVKKSSSGKAEIKTKRKGKRVIAVEAGFDTGAGEIDNPDDTKGSSSRKADKSLGVQRRRKGTRNQKPAAEELVVIAGDLEQSENPSVLDGASTLGSTLSQPNLGKTPKSRVKIRRIQRLRIRRMGFSDNSYHARSEPVGRLMSRIYRNAGVEPISNREKAIEHLIRRIESPLLTDGEKEIEKKRLGALVAQTYGHSPQPRAATSQLQPPSLPSLTTEPPPTEFTKRGTKRMPPGPIDTSKKEQHEVKVIEVDKLKLVPTDQEPLKVPRLSYGLERVLFNPGVYQLQDPRSRVFNFDPYLQTIMPVDRFDFNALKQYVTSSRDKTLLAKCAAEKKKYTGSTSSMTSALSHFHYLLSQWREANFGLLSQEFPTEYKSFNAASRAPVAVFLQWRDGTYAIDADKEFEDSNVLMMLGKSMEKLLTLPTDEFEKYSIDKSDQISEEERNSAEEFHYTTIGDFLLRSQLDAYDPRLPGTGMFDLKTRAVVTVRMDVKKWEEARGYEIRDRYGEWESFEREYYDMIRSAFLKYSLQVRMGRMDGIFVAFHNTERIFGFQYISLSEMDYALHGTRNLAIGDSEFKLSLELLNKILDRATAKFPEKTLRLHFETKDTKSPFMYIFAEPVEDEVVEAIQATNKEKIEKFEKEVLKLKSASRKEQELGWDELNAKIEEEIEQDILQSENTAVEGEHYLDEDLFSSASNAGPLYKNQGAVRMETEHVDGLAVPEADEDAEIEATKISNETVNSSGMIPDIAQQASVEAEDLIVDDTVDDEDLIDEDARLEKRSRKPNPPSPAKMLYAQPNRPLLAMTLVIRNKVNGTYVSRPEMGGKNPNYKETDKWDVEYLLTEIEDPETAQNLFSKCRIRRFNALASTWKSNKAQNDIFLHKLKAMAKKGKTWRSKIEEEERKNPPPVLSTGL